MEWMSGLIGNASLWKTGPQIKMLHMERVFEGGEEKERKKKNGWQAFGRLPHAAGMEKENRKIQREEWSKERI